jgi:hypothetical protein
MGMSKIAKAIDAVLTGERRATAPKFRYADVEMKFSTAVIPHISNGVSLGFKMRKEAWLDEHEWDSVELRSEALRNMKRAMIEEIFGEFRPIILELRASVYDNDLTRMRTLLAELENQMFTDGI